ncbi:MAG: hypothetical protein KY476_14520 [Planctomycetes bacterium]|nr:hypothetical protein [Planctomycetota bacterium]
MKVSSPGTPPHLAALRPAAALARRLEIIKTIRSPNGSANAPESFIHLSAFARPAGNRFGNAVSSIIFASSRSTKVLS